MVEQAKVHIREGDIFQIVLSNRLSAPFEGSLLNTYRILRTINPSPYMFYFSGDGCGGGWGLAGDPGEAGERRAAHLPSGRHPAQGQDRGGRPGAGDRSCWPTKRSWRNTICWWIWGGTTLGKISRFGTVQVEKFHSIERFSHVMHIGSTVRGELREDKRRAWTPSKPSCPPGTLSGAPKLRACQLIGELENNKRGIYGGAIGYIDFTGNMDTCIAIRIAYQEERQGVRAQSGAGIVADSVPEKEYRGVHEQGAGRRLSALELAQEEDAMILLIDNYDSFSYNLYQLVGELEPDIRVIRNDEMTVEEIRALQPRAHHPLPRPRAAGGRRNHHGGGHGPWAGDPHSGRLPGAPGHLRRLRRHRYLRQGS